METTRHTKLLRIIVQLKGDVPTRASDTFFFKVEVPPAPVGADGIQKYKLQNICIQSASTGAGGACT